MKEVTPPLTIVMMVTGNESLTRKANMGVKKYLNVASIKTLMIFR